MALVAQPYASRCPARGLGLISAPWPTHNRDTPEGGRSSGRNAMGPAHGPSVPRCPILLSVCISGLVISPVTQALKRPHLWSQPDGSADSCGPCLLPCAHPWPKAKETQMGWGYHLLFQGHSLQTVPTSRGGGHHGQGWEYGGGGGGAAVSHQAMAREGALL